MYCETVKYVLQSSINLVHSILRKHFRSSNLGMNDPHPAQLPGTYTAFVYLILLTTSLASPVKGVA